MNLNNETIRNRLKYLLARITSIPTPTGEEYRILPFLMHFFEERRYCYQLQTVTRGKQWNMIVSSKNSAVDTAILAHTDTVKAIPPLALYKLQEIGNRWYGRGVIDVKGQIAALLCAIEIFEQEAGYYPDITIFFVCDEEEEGKGSELIPLDNVEGVIVLEPTGLKPMIGYSGDIEYRLYIKLNGGHGSVHHNPDYINMLNKLREELAGINSNLDLKLLAIRAGDMNLYAHPSYVEALVDIKLEPGIKITQVKEQLETMFKKYNMSWKYIEGSEGYVLEESDEWVKRMCRLLTNGKKSCAVYQAWTDAVNIIKRGKKAIVYGAGNISLAHSPFENVEPTELIELTKSLFNLLKTLNQH